MAGRDGSSGLLPGLVCMALAVVMWWAGQSWQEARQASAEQAGTAKRLLAHRSGESAASLEAQRKVVAERRAVIVHRLGHDESLEMARAGLVYELRQRCYEIKLNCQVRLADGLAATASTSAEASAPGAAKPGAPNVDPLAELGVQRVRAVVSGTLDVQEISDLTVLFQRDVEHQWRVNRVQLKAKVFEMDIERHLIAVRD